MTPVLTEESRILIVDDLQTNIMLLDKMLKINGFTNIRSVIDSRMAVDTYLSFKPDLLLLDLRMPYVDGFEVMEMLNEVKGDDYLPVIMITAEHDRKNLMRALELGVKDFIGKPYDQSELIMRIRNMLEMRLLQNLARRHNRELEQKVMERTKELTDTQTEIFNRLLRTAEFRDSITGKHVSRIGHYVRELALLSGMSEAYAFQLYQASMMHDIGKIAIPDKILLKPGKLTPEEYEIMKTHTTIGAKILSGSTHSVLIIAEQIALTHHERWDGKGYPTGLAGERIPLSGRMTALFDVLDALLSERPYKSAWPVDRALSEIAKESGAAFDPNLVQTFLTHRERFLTIAEQYGE